MKRMLFCLVHCFAVSMCQQDWRDIFLVCKNRRLTFETFMSTHAKSKIQCTANCLKEGQCRSALYFGDKKVCELSQEGQNGRECDAFSTEEGVTLLAKKNPCKNNQNYIGGNCICEPPLTGPYCETGGRRDCYGHSSSEWVNIYPEDGLGKIRVFCFYSRLYDFVAPSGGFTTNYLNLTWNAYKYGFGSIIFEASFWIADGGYWLGNVHVHRITNGILSYRLEYFFFGSGSGNYMNFKVANETDNYRLQYSSYVSANVDESLVEGRPFSANDKNDGMCAIRENTGFWFDKGCTIKSPLLGTFQSSGIQLSYSRLWASLIRVP